MTLPNYDQFLADVLRKEKTAFGFVACLTYQADIPGGLVWVLIHALVREKGLTLNQAARVVLDFSERYGKHIPQLLTGISISSEADFIEEQDRQFGSFTH